MNPSSLSSANAASNEGDYCLLNRGEGYMRQEQRGRSARENEIEAQRRPMANLSSLPGYALSNTTSVNLGFILKRKSFLSWNLMGATVYTGYLLHKLS